VAPAGHARGSQGSRLDVEGDAAARAPDASEVLADTGVVVGVVVGAGAVVDGELVCALPGAVVGVGGAGVLTAKLVPVTTVTWAPSTT
jgi:hypothetical protein